MHGWGAYLRPGFHPSCAHLIWFLSTTHKRGDLVGPAHGVTVATKVLILSLPATCQDFTEQFQVLLPKDVQPCREAIAALLEKLQVDRQNYQIGKTKVSTTTLKAAIADSFAPRQDLTSLSTLHCALKGPGLCSEALSMTPGWGTQGWACSTLGSVTLFWELEAGHHFLPGSS